MSSMLAANGLGLGDGRGIEILSPERQPNKELKVQIKNKKMNKEISAGTEAEQRTEADEKHVSPAIAKPNVVCRFACFFFGHKKIKNKCQRCGVQFGVPKMDCPPEPP